MSNKLYDTLRFIADLLLPALGTLYAALGQVWNFPYVEQIVATVMAVVAFMDAVLKVSKTKYDKTQQNLNGED